MIKSSNIINYIILSFLFLRSFQRHNQCVLESLRYQINLLENENVGFIPEKFENEQTGKHSHFRHLYIT